MRNGVVVINDGSEPTNSCQHIYATQLPSGSLEAAAEIQEDGIFVLWVKVRWEA